MTLIERYLAYYEEVCQRSKVEKANAWQQVQEDAKNYPDIYGQAPEILTQRMRQRSQEQRIEG